MFNLPFSVDSVHLYHTFYLGGLDCFLPADRSISKDSMGLENVEVMRI